MFLLVILFSFSWAFAQGDTLDQLSPELQAKLLRAQEVNQASQITDVNEPNTRSVSSLLFETFIGLAIVIGLIFLTVYIMKRLQSSKWGQDSANQLDLEVIQTKMIGPQQRLVIVRVQNEFILLGVTQENISIVKQIDSVGIDKDLLNTPSVGAEFSSTVNQLLARFKKDPQA